MNNSAFNVIAFLAIAAITIAFTGAWFAPLVVFAVAFASLVIMSIASGLVIAVVASSSGEPAQKIIKRHAAFLKTVPGQLLFAITDNLVVFLLIVTFPHALPLLAYDFAIVVTLTRTIIGLLRMVLVEQKAVPA